jgi:uncharacterized lipoprotein YddW (UPF0748 family)
MTVQARRQQQPRGQLRGVWLKAVMLKTRRRRMKMMKSSLATTPLLL